MKHKRNILWPALVVPALFAFAPPGAEIGYHPAQKAVLTKTFANDTENSLDEMTMVQNGQEIDSSMLDMDMSSTAHFEVTVIDEYLETGEGRTLKLKRTYDEINTHSSVSGSNVQGEISQNVEGHSDLEGLSVVFTWSEDAEEYDVAFADDSGGDDDLLEALDMDLDLAGLLPPGEVSEGDTWEVDPASLRPLFAPGGGLSLEMESEDEDLMGMSNTPTPDQLIRELEGDVTAEYGGMRDEGGVQVAVIRLDIDVSAASDLTEQMQEMMEEAAEDQPFEFDIESVDTEFGFEGEGLLLWNVESGLLHSAEISGENFLTIDNAMNVQVQGNDISMEQSMSFSGSYSASVSTEQSS